MSANADRFTGRVDAYEKYRLGYPAAVLDLLREHGALRAGDVIADVGAGTGMVAKLFLAAGHRVLAVEPNAQMRAACARALSSYATLEIVDATAEATGVRTGSIDLVTVGRAFHWFDQARAMEEFRRMLKPGGWVVVLANRRSQGPSAQAEAYEALLLEHGTDYDRVKPGYKSYEGLRPYGEAASFEVTTRGLERLTLQAFLGQTQSYSMAPLPGRVKYAGMQAALHAFFAQWAVNGLLQMETECRVAGWRTPH